MPVGPIARWGVDEPDRRATSHLGPQYVDLATGCGRVEPVLDQPADRRQTSQRPPAADHVEVDLGAVAGYNVGQVLVVSERQAGEVVHGVASTCLGPVEDAGDLVPVDEHV